MNTELNPAISDPAAAPVCGKRGPTFINIGPGRCATSWLLEALKAHPEIEMSRVKETEYFNTNMDREHEWYLRQFPTTDTPAVGEISSNYYLDENVPQRIADFDSSIQLLINLRNPYTLLESFYGFGIRRGLELPPLEEALDVPVGRLMGSGFEGRQRQNALTVSDSRTLLESVCLFDRLQPFFDAFSQDQIHYLVFERLQIDHRGVLSDLYDFLGVDSKFMPGNADKIVNPAIQPKSKMVARFATGTASVLRRVGAYCLLAKLHRSELLKQVLFREDTGQEAETRLRERLPESVRSQLDEQIEKMERLHPQLAELW